VFDYIKGKEIQPIDASVEDFEKSLGSNKNHGQYSSERAHYCHFPRF
jgi:hypothetical protein